MRNLLTEFLRGFPLRILIFLLDMVLPQLDAYHAGRQLTTPVPYGPVCCWRNDKSEVNRELSWWSDYGYEAFAGFHVMQLITECIPLFALQRPKRRFLPRHHGVCVKVAA